MQKLVYASAIQLTLRAYRIFENRPKIDGPSVMIGAVLCLLSMTGCHKPVQETAQGVDVGDAKAAATKILEADQFYAGREDLDKVRKAVAILRQARIEDYGSFEAAWKLSRADFYVGDHTTDDRERDKSFQKV